MASGSSSPMPFQSTLPARGATCRRIPAPTRRRYFNPRSPHGERRTTTTDSLFSIAFQSTLPARGATPPDERRTRNRPISIHAPRTGSDVKNDSMDRDHRISIHAPRTGSDAQSRNPQRNRGISIHAPRTGSDANGSSVLLMDSEFQSTLPARGATRRSESACRMQNFNPRSPHGERPPSSPLLRRRSTNFNPRSPHGERHFANIERKIDNVFQSTLPARGATKAEPRQKRRGPFQSTLPARGATRCRWQTASPRLFQSTLPARGATFM